MPRHEESSPTDPVSSTRPEPDQIVVSGVLDHAYAILYAYDAILEPRPSVETPKSAESVVNQSKLTSQALLIVRLFADRPRPGEPSRHAYDSPEVATYRFYDPNLQRWLNRDPIEEHGGFNLYGFVNGNPIGIFDLLGLCDRFGPLGDLVPESVYNAANTAATVYGVGAKMVNDSIIDTAQVTLDAMLPDRDVDVYGILDWLNSSTLDDPNLMIGVMPAIGPVKPYNRLGHYSRTPTAADRAALGAKANQVVDHEPPLVKRYYEGDKSIGEKPGKHMTADELKASANDRSRMRLQDKSESNAQGGVMSNYSKQQKKNLCY